MSDGPDHADVLERIAAELRQRPRARNWIDAFRICEVLPLSKAAEVAAADRETIRRWCVDAEYTDTPLGYLIADTWLIDVPELMRALEARRGARARQAAETRLAQYREQQSVRNLEHANGPA